MRRIVIGVVAVALVAVAAVVYLSRDDKKYVVYARFNDAGGILKNYNVKIGQIAAGTVKEIKLDKQDNAVVKMEMDDGAYPIGAGATAKVRPVNLLGEKYIDLDPGDLKRPVKSGSTIELSKTGVPIELDDALNTMDLDTRGAMRMLINETGIAVAGRGADFNKLLGDLPPAIDKARDLVTQVDQENVRLKSMIDSGDRDLTAVNAKKDDLSAMIASAKGALETAATRRQQLGQTIQTAPGALTQLRSTLGTLQATSQALMPTADDVVKTAPSLRQTLDRLPAFADDADSTLARVQKVSPTLGKLGRRSTPTLRVLRPTMERLDQFSSDIGPLINALDPSGRDASGALLEFINGWAGVTDGQDKLGHLFRLRAILDSDSFETFLDQTGNRPKAKKQTKDKPAKAADPGPSEPSSTTSDTPAPSAPSTDRKPDIDVVPGVKVPDPQQVVKDATDAVGGLLGGKQQTNPSPPPSSSGDGDAGKLLNYLLGS